MLHLKGENDMCIYCDGELKGLHEHWTGVCAVCDKKMGGEDEEDLDPYAGCDMTPDSEGRTTGDVNDR